MKLAEAIELVSLPGKGWRRGLSRRLLPPKPEHCLAVETGDGVDCACGAHFPGGLPQLNAHIEIVTEASS